MSGRRSKYGAQKTNGFDSKKESKRAQELIILERAGVISQLEFQPRYELIPADPPEKACFYTADARYIEDGKLVVEDTKSVASRTQQYIIRRKLMWHKFRIAIRET